MKQFGIEILSYCLMTNHYHLLIRTPQPNLSRMMQWLLTTYTVRFNLRHHRVGHLFQGRFKALIVDTATYLARVSRYIHLNPCKPGMVARPEDYPWSSFREFLDPRERSFLTPEPVLEHFASAEDYRRYVYQGLATPDDVLAEARGGLVLGSDAFFEEIKERLKISGGELPVEAAAGRPEWEAVLGDESRAMKVYALSKWAGVRQQELATTFGVSVQAVSQMIRRLARKAETDDEVRLKLQDLESRTFNLRV